MIPRAIAIKDIGIITLIIILDKIVIPKRMIGCSAVAEVIPPLATSKVTSTGNKQLTKETRFSIECLINVMISIKFFIIILIMRIYDVK